MSAPIECREVYVPRNRLTGEGGYATFVRRSRTGSEGGYTGRPEDLHMHGRRPVEIELGVFHEGDSQFHHLVIEVMAPEKSDNGRVWTMWRELARIDVNRLALENPEIPYPGIFRVSAMAHPSVTPDDSGNTKPQSEAPEQA